MAAKRLFITLAPGKQEGELSTTRLGVPSSLLLLRGKVMVVREDDSREEGVGKTLATSLVSRGRCIYCNPDGSPVEAGAEKWETVSSTVTVSPRQKRIRHSVDAASEPDAAQ